MEAEARTDYPDSTDHRQVLPGQWVFDCHEPRLNSNAKSLQRLSSKPPMHSFDSSQSLQSKKLPENSEQDGQLVTHCTEAPWPAEQPRR